MRIGYFIWTLNAVLVGYEIGISNYGAGFWTNVVSAVLGFVLVSNRLRILERKDS